MLKYVHEIKEEKILSLPSVAKFYNNDDEFIVESFINAGWFITPNSLVEVVMTLPIVYNVKYCEIYYIEVPCELLPGFKQWESRSVWKQELISFFTGKI